MSYSNGLLSDQSYQTANKYVPRGLPGVGFKLTVTGDYDMQNKKLTNVKSGTNSNDAVNKSQLDTTTNLLHGSRAGDVVNDKAVIYSNTGAVHANSLYIEDSPDQGNSNEVRIMTEHQSYPNIHLNIPDLHNFDGHGSRPKSELMVTSVEQTVTGKKVFENIEVHDPTSNNQAANKNYADTKLSLTGGTMTGDLILPHHNYPIPGNTNKVINYESQREIFLSRQESFPMQADINMNNNFIQNIATPTSSHQVTNKGYCDYNFLNRQSGGVLMGPLSMNRNDLTGIPDTPKFGYSAVNKNYVDGEISKIPGTDTSPFLKIDGSRAMTGNLDMGYHSIQKVGDPVNSDDVATKNYVDAEIGYISTPFLKLDGTRAMTGILNMNNHQIKNLKTPSEDNDAINKKYLKDELMKSHLLPSHHENAFKYLLDADESSSERNIIVHGIANFNGSYHENKKAYDVDMVYTTGTQNYDSRIGINIYPLPAGKFTIIMEYFYPENLNIAVLCQASSAQINKQISKNFSGYMKLLVQFEDRTKQTPDYLYFDISGSGTTSTNPEGYLIFYGIKEWYDEVPPEIYDHALESSMFEYDNGFMRMNVDIDINKYRISNIANAINPGDAINKGQLDIIKNKFDSQLFYLKNYSYMSIFTYHFYDFKEPSKFIFSGNHIIGIEPSLKIASRADGYRKRSINDLDPISGLQFINYYFTGITLSSNVDQVSPFTLMISLTLKGSGHLFVHFDHFTPYWQINSANMEMIFVYDGNTELKKSIPQLKGKQVMLWISFDPISQKYRMSLSNTIVLEHIAPPPMTFSSNYLEIATGDNIINKICFQNKYIPSEPSNIDYTRILYEEKMNGSIVG